MEHQELRQHTGPTQSRVNGERNGRAILTEDNVRTILTLRNIISQTDLAEIYGVDRTTIGKIHRGKIWRHVR